MHGGLKVGEVVGDLIAKITRIFIKISHGGEGGEGEPVKKIGPIKSRVSFTLKFSLFSFLALKSQVAKKETHNWVCFSN